MFPGGIFGENNFGQAPDAIVAAMVGVLSADATPAALTAIIAANTLSVTATAAPGVLAGHPVDLVLGITAQVGIGEIKPITASGVHGLLTSATFSVTANPAILFRSVLAASTQPGAKGSGPLSGVLTIVASSKPTKKIIPGATSQNIRLSRRPSPAIQ